MQCLYSDARLHFTHCLSSPSFASTVATSRTRKFCHSHVWAVWFICTSVSKENELRFPPSLNQWTQSHHSVAAAICLYLSPHLPSQRLLRGSFSSKLATWPLASSVPHLSCFICKGKLQFGKICIIQHSFLTLVSWELFLGLFMHYREHPSPLFTFIRNDIFGKHLRIWSKKITLFTVGHEPRAADFVCALWSCGKNTKHKLDSLYCDDIIHQTLIYILFIVTL